MTEGRRQHPGWWMSLAVVLWLIGSGVAAASPCHPPFDRRSTARADRPPSLKTVRAQLDELRVPFVANEGRLDDRVAYYVPAPGSPFFVTQDGELVYALRGRTRSWALTEAFVGGRTRPAGRDRAATSVSLLHGNDPARWRAALPTYRALDLGEVWPGVTVSLHARGQGIEKVFTLQPGGSVDRIRLRVTGAQALALNGGGALVASTGLGDVAFTPPVAYQERGGVREPVHVAYRVEGPQYGFTVGAYDLALPLVIDPLLQSTYLGGAEDDVAYAVKVHPATGDVYVAGKTKSLLFPQTTGGAYDQIDGELDAFVARLSSNLKVLHQATYLGGGGWDIAFALAIHPQSGDVYVAGRTDSDDFPKAAEGAQPERAGFDDAFVARFPSDLTTLTQATYFGGNTIDEANALAIHPDGHVYIAGTTDSGNLPGRIDGAQPGLASRPDAFVARFTSDLKTLNQSTYLGGNNVDTGFALAIAPNGEVYVAGETNSTDFPGFPGPDPLNNDGCSCAMDAYVARLASDLKTLDQATYVGGKDSEEANGLAIHPVTGIVYVAGSTWSDDLPGTFGRAQEDTGGFRDAFVAELSSTLSGHYLATYLGGSDDEQAWSVAIHPLTSEVYVAGGTASADFPFTAGGAQDTFGGCDSDMFVARLTADLISVPQATYLGDANYDEGLALAISPLTGSVYVAGETESPFPGTTGGAQEDFGGGLNDGVVARLTQLLSLTEPDLEITKTHVGDFLQHQIGATYTLRVTNAGTAPTDLSTVTVTDTLPAGLTATGLAGSGWACTLAPLQCTRSGAPLGIGQSFPDITLTVDVAGDAAASVVNTAQVSGGGDTTIENNTASDPTTILPVPDLTITKTHVGGFLRGQVGAAYTLRVTNVGTAPTDLTTVMVTDTLPAGLTATGFAGSGWACTLAPLQCTRSGAPLGIGQSFPDITLTVDVAGNAAASIVNTAQVSGGGDNTPGNNTATDPTTTSPAPDLSIAVAGPGTLHQGDKVEEFTFTVTNNGSAPTDRRTSADGPSLAFAGAPVTVTITLPPGVIAVALSGPGWTCTLATLTCTRSDSLPVGASYPPITLTVKVQPDAPTGTVVVTATVTGGNTVNPAGDTATSPITILAAVPIPALSALGQVLAIGTLLLVGLFVLRRRAAARA
jgi:uncharacterized repeat protein (TIGR01451 family)